MPSANSKLRVTVTENGPYVVTGGIPLAKQRVVFEEFQRLAILAADHLHFAGDDEELLCRGSDGNGLLDPTLDERKLPFTIACRRVDPSPHQASTSEIGPEAIFLRECDSPFAPFRGRGAVAGESITDRAVIIGVREAERVVERFR